MEVIKIVEKLQQNKSKLKVSLQELKKASLKQ